MPVQLIKYLEMLFTTILLGATVALAGEITVFSGDGCVFRQAKIISSQNSECIPFTNTYAAEVGRNVFPPCTFTLYSDSNCENVYHTLDTSKGPTGHCLSGPADVGSSKRGYKSLRVTCNPSEVYPLLPSSKELAEALNGTVDLSTNITAPVSTRTTFELPQPTLRKRDTPIEILSNGVSYIGIPGVVAGITVGAQNIVSNAVTYGYRGRPPLLSVIYPDARSFIYEFWAKAFQSRQYSYERTFTAASGLRYRLTINGLNGYAQFEYIIAMGPTAFMSQIIDALEGMARHNTNRVSWEAFVNGVRFVSLALQSFH